MPYKNKEKQKAAQRKYWLDNKSKYNAKTEQRRLERSKWWASYKEEQKFTCSICGENHPACIAFHHRDANEKNMGVSTLVAFAYPVDVILAEIAKCDVLCHNCHAKHHWTFDDRRRNRVV